MVALTPWIERRFNFDFPAGLLPCIAERLTGTPLRIESMIHGLSAGKLTARTGGKWSLQEHIGHLIDLEELHEGRLDDFDNGLKVLRAADMANKKTWEADHNSRKINDLLGELKKVRGRFISRLEKMDEAQLFRSALHPRLQTPMRVVDVAFFTAEHDDHHIALMRNIL
jgi:hypothetical protein